MAGRGRVPAVAIELSDAERAELESLTRRRRTAQGLARRAQIVLSAAQGLQNKQIAASLGTDPMTVSKWRRRFAERKSMPLMINSKNGRLTRIFTVNLSGGNKNPKQANPYLSWRMK